MQVDVLIHVAAVSSCQHWYQVASGLKQVVLEQTFRAAYHPMRIVLETDVDNGLA